MNYKEAKAKCLNPQCILHHDEFVIIDENTGECIESAGSLKRAEWAAQALTDHEVRCGRLTKYRVEVLDRIE